MHIGIDPGHGGPAVIGNGINETGTMALGIPEGVWSLSFAAVLKKHLGAAGHTVKLTREYDTVTYPVQRNARTKQCDLVLSIHANAEDLLTPYTDEFGRPMHRAKSPTLHGLECYVWPGNSRTKALAFDILRHCPPALRRHNQPFYASANVDWMKNARAVVGMFSRDCILIECGYATWPADRRYLLSDSGKNELAAAVAAALPLEARNV